jgi:prepilin-type N-terminal cleavage/methylation domain-containing protein
MLVQQKQNIKGISLVEMLVVLTIIGAIAGVGFPNFSKWQVDRKVRAASEKIATVFTLATSQVERGAYPYVRVLIQSGVKISAHGITQEEFSNKLNNGDDIDCGAGIFSSADEIISYTLEDIILFHLNDGGGSAAICFSKGGKYFKRTGTAASQNNINLDQKATPNFITICYKKEKSCDAVGRSFDKDDKQPVYLVNYSRFGMIQKFKWNYSTDDWRSR